MRSMPEKYISKKRIFPESSRGHAHPIPGFCAGKAGGSTMNSPQYRSRQEADLGYRNTRLSPKGLFHPIAERMFEDSLAKPRRSGGPYRKENRQKDPPRLLGMRPCDARACTSTANFVTPNCRTPGGEQGASG